MPPSLIGIHDFNNRPANNYNISNAAIGLWQKLNEYKPVTCVFGNVFASANFCGAATLAVCYQDDNITQQVAADIVEGKLPVAGKLPVSVCNFKSGDGIATARRDPLPVSIS